MTFRSLTIEVMEYAAIPMLSIAQVPLASFVGSSQSALNVVALIGIGAVFTRLAKAWATHCWVRETNADLEKRARFRRLFREIDN